MHPRRRTALALTLALVTACAQDTSPEPTPTSSSDVSAADLVVEVHDNDFAPVTAEVGVGDTVAWDFSTAGSQHNVVFDDGPASDVLDDGTWSTSLDEPGTHAYECTLHRGMTGEITVAG